MSILKKIDQLTKSAKGDVFFFEESDFISILGSDYRERMFSTNTQYTYHMFEEKGQWYYLFTEFNPYEGNKLLKSPNESSFYRIVDETCTNFNAKRREELGRQLLKLEAIKKEFLFIEEIKNHPSVRLKWLFKEK